MILFVITYRNYHCYITQKTELQHELSEIVSVSLAAKSTAIVTECMLQPNRTEDFYLICILG
jgi:hypothetical protein